VSFRARELDGASVGDVVGRLAAAGFTRVAVPAAGTHVDPFLLCQAREALAARSPLADAVLAVLGLGCYPVALAGQPGQDAAFVAPVRQGHQACGFALTEPEAGSDVAAMATTAEPAVGGGWRLRGKKTFISNAPIAAWFTVFARTPAGPSAFIVRADDPGVHVLADVPMSVEHPIGSLALDDALVPADRLVGQEGQGIKLALGTLDVFRVSVAAAAQGMAARALEDSLARVKARVQFGKPLAEFQLTQARLADMATRLEASRGLTRAACEALAAGSADAKRRVAMAKLFATEAAQTTIDDAVQLHGGLGVTRGVVVEALYREIRALRIYEGTSEIQKLIIARDLLRA
jgi:acyl-CoA dehydrogenase